MVDKTFKPMLADNKFNLKDHGKKLTFPAYLSPKLDGIRVILHPELGPVTRNLKPVRNKYARKVLQQYIDWHPETHWLDGEIIVGEPTAPNAYNITVSAIQSFEGEPDFQFYVFDKFHPTKKYPERYEDAELSITNGVIDRFLRISFLTHYEVSDLDELIEYEEEMVKEGYEGIMYRHPEGLYKQGRSTLNQQWLLKIKRWADAEATIINFQEKMFNDNEQTINELGYAQRSSHKANLRPADTLGAYEVEILNGDFEGKILMVSPAFHTHEKLKEVWDNQWGYVGKVMTFRYMPHGSKDLPRFPKFLRWKED